jgi:hypothetical protein
MLAQSEVQKDPFDDENFDPIKYINEIFPNEESLENLDTIMSNVKGVKSISSPHPTKTRL